MEIRAERHHWLNTIVGILDQAFHLTDEEQFHVIGIVSRLLASLDVPDRATPRTLPVPVVLEITSSFYTQQLSGPRRSGVVRPVRAASGDDIVVSLETWRESLLALLTAAYPDLVALERLVASKVLTDMLAAIGVPERAAAFFPDDVVRLAREIDGA